MRWPKARRAAGIGVRFRPTWPGRLWIKCACAALRVKPCSSKQTERARAKVCRSNGPNRRGAGRRHRMGAPSRMRMGSRSQAALPRADGAAGC
jgi:hypothetical protein